MNIKTTLPISEARIKIFDIAEAVQKPGVHYTFTANGRPRVVMMSAEEFESLQETIEVMRDFPDLEKDVAAAEQDYRKGNYITLEELLAKEGFVVADKGKKAYAIQTRHTRKGSKRSK